MDCDFHCSKRISKVARKSKHRLFECCDTLKIVLANNPEYGVIVKDTDGLRKMRVRVPALNVGKSGGYRLIYKAQLIDEVWKVVLLATYFKGDCEDLSDSDYIIVSEESKLIFESAEDIKWETA